MEKKTKHAIVGATCVLIVILVLGAVSVVRYLAPGTEWKKLSEYYSLPENEAMVILNGKIYEKNALLAENMVYLDMETVQSQFNFRFYWDSAENVLTYTTPNEIIRAEVGNPQYSVDKEKKTLSHSVIKSVGQKAYVSIEFVAMYSNMTYECFTAERDGKEQIQRVLITNDTEARLYVKVKKDTQVRTEADRKSLILSEARPDDVLMVLNGTSENGYLKIMTSDGIRGYISQKCVTEGYYQSASWEYTAPEYTSVHKDKKINLVWNMVTNESANNNISELMKNTKGINVVSPTWFSVNSNEGTIASLASEEYVSWAHDRGLEVWGLVDNFNPEVEIHKVLSKTSLREKLVNEIVAAAIRYNLDGINIDFESLASETGVHFIQFLRELSVKCRNNKLVLSVDNYVPASYNKFYNFAEQGILVDYVIIMAYDEHYSGSAEAGSVASIGYVENAIKDTIAMVPSEKVIIGLPFYTRLWKEKQTESGVQLTSEALSMNSVDATLSANNAAKEWDEETAQYYAEYQKEGTTYKIWLEEEESIERKLMKVHEANVAGVAAWRLGYEKNSIWDVILKYVN